MEFGLKVRLEIHVRVECIVTGMVVSTGRDQECI